MAVRCRRCGRPLSAPASVQLGYGPICARRLGIVRFGEKTFRKMFDFSCACPYCGAFIERVTLNEWGTSWQWTCGGVSGDGCHTDFGCNTVAPLKFDLSWQRKHKPHIFDEHKREREYHREVANRTFENLGFRAVPPYPGLRRTMIQPMDAELLKKQIMEIVAAVHKEFHEQKGRYGMYCTFYNPTIGHCIECGCPTKKTELKENNRKCLKCVNK